ncbi:MAG: trimeric intracellular cation channel family protein [Flavobacteriaceae bacterium]
MAGPFLLLLDLAGVAVFAAAGALAASRRQLDIVSFLFMAAVTGLGGGTLRDLLLGATPIFWISDGRPLALCAAVAVIVYLFAHKLESRYRALLWADAIGMAAYAIVGSAKALAVGAGIAPAILLGVISATFGGIVRDVLTGEKSVLLRREVYVTAALLGAAVFVLADLAGLSRPLAVAAGFLAGFGLRAGALLFGWALPIYRARPGAGQDRETPFKPDGPDEASG